MNGAPLFSVIVTTCRGDKPFLHKPDWHVLDKIVENCEKQTFRDFELIIVDLCWDLRMEWSEGLGDMGFPILHIPDRSTIFRDLSLVRISASRNTGLIYARGDAVIFSDDGQEWSETAFELLKPWAENGAGSTCRLHRDNGNGPIEVDSRWVAYSIDGTLKTKVVLADGVGYLGGTLSMVPTKKMVECNGWDEMFDGARQLEDSDMARRLGATGLKMALEGHASVTEYSHNPCSGHIHRCGLDAKCNGSYIYPIWKAQPDRVVANDRILTDDELDMFMPGECTILTKGGICGTSKDRCEARWNRRSLMNIYKDKRLVFDLAELRKDREWESAAHDPLLQV